MARIRSAKPDFWTDPVMCALPRLTRWTFKGLWEVCADDAGRFLADARVIKGQLWPLDDDISARKIETHLTQLEACGRVRLYVVARVRYGIVVNFLRHQKISHPTPSKLPDPPDTQNDDRRNGSRIPPESPNDDLGSASGITPEVLGSHSGAIPEHFRPERDVDLERDVDVDVDKSGMLSGGGFRKTPHAALSRSREMNRPHERQLPPGALDVLAKMSAECREDGEQQLRAALDHPEGAKISRGIYARAQSPEHLEHACQHVLKKLPTDRDVAVRWVLNKLREPWAATDGNGRTVTEAAAHNARAEEQRDNRDRRQRLADAEEWAASHADEWGAIESRITAEFPGHEHEAITASALRMALVSAKLQAAEAATEPASRP